MKWDELFVTPPVAEHTVCSCCGQRFGLLGQGPHALEAGALTYDEVRKWLDNVFKESARNRHVAYIGGRQQGKSYINELADLHLGTQGDRVFWTHTAV